MPSGEPDVTPELDSSPSSPTDTQVLEPQGSNQGAAPGESQETPPSTPEGSDAKSATLDPVQEAIKKLARPEVEAVPADPAAKPKAPSEEKTAEPAAKTKEGPTLEDPYAGWLSEAQRALLKPQTRERITELHAKWKAAETHPDRVVGTEFNQMLSGHQLQDDIGFVPPDHLAGLVKIQAAVNRSIMATEQGRRPASADLQAFQAFAQTVDNVRAKFGLQAQPVDTAAKPFEGQLSGEYQDLVDVYGIPEKRVRLLAALEKAPVAPPAQAHAAQQPAAQANLPPEGVDMEALHARRAAGAMATAGIPAERMAAYQKTLEPAMQGIVQEMFPGLEPSRVVPVFNALSAKERVDIFLRAHQEAQVPKAPVPPKAPSYPAPTRQPHGGKPPRAVANADAMDPVEAAIARLSRPSDA